MYRTIATGSRIQSHGINFDESVTYATTKPAMPHTIRYVHNRWCSRRIAASCSSRIFKRPQYSLSAVWYVPLFKAVGKPTFVGRANSESGIPHHLPPGTGAWFCIQAKAVHDRPDGGMRLTLGGTTGRRSVGDAERAEKDLVHREL